MCKRNADCVLCSTFRGKSLDECKKEKKCEENVLEVQIVDDIKKKTGKISTDLSLASGAKGALIGGSKCFREPLLFFPYPLLLYHSSSPLHL